MQEGSADAELRRLRFRVTGIVQGVGFRPYVFNLASGLGLAGFVLNDSEGVLLEVEGSPAACEAFAGELATSPPPLALIESTERHDVAPLGTELGFRISHSEHAGQATALISPDVATCDDCLREMMDPADRRFRYAFTNCTNCGPRFTISKAIPYDRPNTTMSAFDMCLDCRREYEDPADRRFHAQPIACPVCGPQLSLLNPSLELLAGDPVVEAARLLGEGAILAVKGLGGYHLTCRADDEDAVAKLRSRKAREEKPFAVMAADLKAAGALASVGAEEARVLVSRRRPIVLLERRPEVAVAGGVAPNNRYLGVMLPYTPLHHLLLKEVGGPIVCTSGNLSDEPIAYRDRDAVARLDRIADFFLAHDRDIHMRCDDSVVRLAGSPRGVIEQPMRRARGYAPEPIPVSPAFREPVLAAGPELKHTFCIGAGGRAIVSHHLGDMENWETMQSFLEGVEHYQRVFEVRPGVVAHDLHPEYLVTKWAKELDGVRLVGVQHHHAHIASCLADNFRCDRVVGLALDGTGYGDDGNLWGCEVMVADLSGYERAASLEYVPLPGGAAAVKEPWRMGAVYLNAAFGTAAAGLELEFVRRTASRWGPILTMASKGLNAPLTSSAGRLFDAAAAVAGLSDTVSYEGQAAIELEQVADTSVKRSYSCPVVDRRMRGADLIGALAEDVARGVPVPEVAAAFHNGLAAALVEVALEAVRGSGLRTVALSGGTFQNQLLVERVARPLENAGLEVLTHSRVPPNDGGISLGQAVIAGAQLAG
ncbi:MAG TPA: carbamoyltransferase HypF [Actinomycetota bacterium]|nr:carbamoyltransferase HypF [Actinomycetota bacterium]